MERTTAQQILRRLESEKDILFALPEQPSTDALCSALACSGVLERRNKQTTIAASNVRLPEDHPLFTEREKVQTALTPSDRLVINVDVARSAVKELSYDVRGDALQIYLTPQHGPLSPKDVSVAHGLPPHTLIVVLDATDLSQLGQLYEENKNFFSSTPIINIDHHSGNTEFGLLNLVDLRASSTAEILSELFSVEEGYAIDERAATQLFAGLIAKTGGLHSPAITPKTLSVASSLLSAGARREEVFQSLSPLRSVAALRLWGRVLARLKTDMQERIYWTYLRREDFTNPEEAHAASPQILEELRRVIQGAEIIVLLSETANGAPMALAWSQPSIRLSDVFSEYQLLRSGGFFRFPIPVRTLSEAEEHLCSVIQRAQ
ncbi:MAG: DHH family phosphoesterase, partial [bacterium]